MDRKEVLPEEAAAPRRLTLATIAGSALLAVALVGVYLLFRSQLALAQAADSLFDMIGGAGLLWALHHSQRPADREHPQGHQLAQPVAALVVAVLAGVLAAEVLRSAAAALFESARPVLDWPVAAVFAGKVLFKGIIVSIAGRLLRRGRNPALSALRMDARNDVLVGSLALIGLGLERLGLPRVDPLLAIGVALYIAYAGLQLGRENASLLLGESASLERQQQLLARAFEVPGVRSAGALLAVWRGTRLSVQLTAAVDAALSLRAAHEIGHSVEQRLLQEPDVGEVIVHVEPI
jgi:ferrous-iron efflux pump FieF